MQGLKENIPDETKFINYINDHYKELENKYCAYCKQNNYKWDWDIFQDTILKCYEAIGKKGILNDTTNQGIENYFFISFKLNIKREGQYARNQKRDLNFSSENINETYEKWYNENNSSSREKLVADLWTDFSILYIMRTVEDQFDEEHFYLFKLKTLCGYTYKQLQEHTQAKKCRQKVVEVKNWLKANVTKDKIKEAFGDIYSDII